MIQTLYDCFKHWSKTGSVYIISDTHFEDSDCKLMDPNWITPQEQVDIINHMMYPTDTLVHLGDVGNPVWIGKMKPRYKVLILGNHDQSAKKFVPYFDEIYTGALFIADKILLSHEPISLQFCLNIHGHDHSGVEKYKDRCKHINMAANICNYTPMNLGKEIKKGILSDIDDIHKMTIDRAEYKKKVKDVFSVFGENGKEQLGKHFFSQVYYGDDL